MSVHTNAIHHFFDKLNGGWVASPRCFSLYLYYNVFHM